MLTTLAIWSLAAAVILGAAWLVGFAMRQRSAAARHAMWCVAVLAVLAWPLMWRWAPRWEASLPHLAFGDGSVVVWPAETTAGLLSPATDAANLSVAGAPGEAVIRDDLRVAIRIDVALLLVWAIGVLMGLSRLVGRYRYAARMVAMSSPLTDGDWHARRDRMIALLHLNRSPGLRVSAAVDLPVVWGFGGGTIVLPGEMLDAPADSRSAILLHEGAHLARQDHLTQLAASLLVVFLWYHPFAWLARESMLRERELACDDLVLTAGVRASTYAEDLLRAALRHQRNAMPALPALVRRRGLERRIAAITDRTRDRRTPARHVVWGLTVFATVAIGGASGFRPREAAADETTITTASTIPVRSAEGTAPDRRFEEDDRGSTHVVPAADWQQVADGACPPFIGRKDLVRHCVTRAIELAAVPHPISGGQNGSITVMGWNRPAVRIVARIDAQANDSATAVALARSIGLAVGDALEPIIPELGTAKWAAVHFEIMVPHTALLMLKTNNGGIALRDLGGVIDITTVNGTVLLDDVNGRVSARGNNASFQVALGSLSTGARIDLESLNGNVRVHLHEPYDAGLDLGSRTGTVTAPGITGTDSAIDCLDRKEGCIGRRLLIGDQSGTRLSARTMHGDVLVTRTQAGAI